MFNLFFFLNEPLLIVNADDDNFINPSAKKKFLKFKNENIALCQTKFGGHVGFMSGWFGDTNWVSCSILIFFV